MPFKNARRLEFISSVHGGHSRAFFKKEAVFALLALPSQGALTGFEFL